MKSIFGILGIIFLGFVVQSYMPWWTIAFVAALFGAVIKFSTLQSYLVGFFGVFLLWGVYAGILNSGNDGILAAKMGILFGELSAFQMVIVTALLGGIIGGFGALTGKLGRNLLSQ